LRRVLLGLDWDMPVAHTGGSCDLAPVARGRLVVEDTLNAVEDCAPMRLVAALKQPNHRGRTRSTPRDIEL
jgi:hypothetical protein